MITGAGERTKVAGQTRICVCEVVRGLRVCLCVGEGERCDVHKLCRLRMYFCCFEQGKCLSILYRYACVGLVRSVCHFSAEFSWELWVLEGKGGRSFGSTSLKEATSSRRSFDLGTNDRLFDIHNREVLLIQEKEVHPNQKRTNSEKISSQDNDVDLQ